MTAFIIIPVAPPYHAYESVAAATIMLVFMLVMLVAVGVIGWWFITRSDG